MADPSSPYPEVPEVVLASARKAAVDAYNEEASGLGGAVDAAIFCAFRAGRAQAAADIRSERERWERLGYDDSGAWVAAHRIALAERHEGTGTDRDGSTLPASRPAGIHGETPTEGGRA